MNNLPIHFILGFIRSGSTLLMSLCRTHPEIETDVQEPNHIYKLFHQVFFDWQAYKKILGISPSEVQNMHAEAVMNFTQTYYQRLCSRTKRTTVVIKQPWITFRINEIMATFPEAKVVLLSRHPYQALASTVDFTMNNWAAENMFEGKRKMWKILEVYGEAMSAIIRCKHNPKNRDRILFLKFEDLLENPHEKLKEVFGWYQVDNSNKIVTEVLEKAQNNKAALLGTCLLQSKFMHPKDKFKTLLTGDERKKIETKAAPYIKEFGYE